jgi:hypothetical protein
MKRLLILEDDDEKFVVIARLVSSISSGICVTRVVSVNEAQQALKGDSYVAAIIDMSVPLFTGRPNFRGDLESLGGELVIREITRRKLPIPCFVVSGFDEFLYHGREASFLELVEEIKARFPKVIGGVYYSSGRRGFAEEFRDLLFEYL